MVSFRVGAGGTLLGDGNGGGNFGGLPVQAEEGAQAREVAEEGGTGLGVPDGKAVPPAIGLHAPPTGAAGLRLQLAEDAQQRGDLLAEADQGFHGEALDGAELGPEAARVRERRGDGLALALGDVGDGPSRIPERLQVGPVAQGGGVAVRADDPRPGALEGLRVEARAHQRVQVGSTALVPFPNHHAVHAVAADLGAHPAPQPLPVLRHGRRVGRGEVGGVRQRQHDGEARDLVRLLDQTAAARVRVRRHLAPLGAHGFPSGGGLRVDQDAAGLDAVALDLDRGEPAGRAWGLLTRAVSPYEPFVTKSRRHRSSPRKGAARARGG